MHLIEEAARVGRVDVFVQSTDKNLMVPVGGAIIAGFDAGLIGAIAKTYPGRASASPLIDVLITLLSMGKDEYVRLLKERKENYVYLKQRLSECALKYGERLLEVPGNPISMAVTLTSRVSALGSPVPENGAESGDSLEERACLDQETPCDSADGELTLIDHLQITGNSTENEFVSPPTNGAESLDVAATANAVDMVSASASAAGAASSSLSRLETELGSMLFTRCVSGARAVSSASTNRVNGVDFVGWGAHCDDYPHCYLTAGVGIGMTKREIDVFIQRLDKVFKKWKSS